MYIQNNRFHTKNRNCSMHTDGCKPPDKFAKRLVYSRFSVEKLGSHQNYDGTCSRMKTTHSPRFRCYRVNVNG